ncbi:MULTISPECIES: SHOCT domain-containing protein [unclassified Curtobacterium]|uniref:SHOCT domain-containing protein n=1 Tax=unclassified Curtobacterium TaxID=257496 RepID=UPI003A807BCA
MITAETHNPLVPPVYDLVWSVVVALVVVAVVVAIVFVVRRSRRATGGSREQRLAELDDLRARGVISDEEHRAARAEALRD